jgi:hypothetical protein
MSPTDFHRAAAAAMAVLAGYAPAWAGTFTITTLDQPGFNQNLCTALNDKDTVVGYSFNTGGSTADFRAFSWHDGVLHQGVKGELQAINAKGIAAGYYEPQVGFLGETFNTKTNKPKTLTGFNKQWFVVDPLGINAAGTLVGIAGTNGAGQHGFILTGKTATILDSLIAPPDSSGAQAINDSGTVAGFWHEANSSNYIHSFIYKDGLYTNADVPHSIETGILYLDNAGSTAGRYTKPNGDWVGFTNVAGKISSYSFPGSVKYNEVRGITADGEVVGWWSSASTTHGMLVIGGKYIQFDVPGAAGTYIGGINALGSIYGYYFDKAFNFHAYVAQCPAGQTPCTK